MSSRDLLRVSLTANGVLAAWLIVEAILSHPSTPQLHSMPSSSALSVHEAISGSSFVTPASQTDISQTDYEKLAFLARVEHVYNASVLHDAVGYWRRPATPIGSALERELSVADAIRRSLLGEYGNEAVHDRLFKRLFYPLGTEFEFLSSEKQIAIFRLRSESRQSSVGSQPVSVSAMQLSAREYMENVSALLTEEEFYEFQLRESPLAQRLRALAFEWREDEFRAVYAIRARANDNESLPNAHPHGFGRSTPNQNSTSLYDPEVEAALGWTRYIEFLKAQDPLHRRLQTAATASRPVRAPSDVDDAYQEYVRLSHEVVELSRSGNTSMARQRAQQRDTAISAQWGLGTPPSLDFGSTLDDLLSGSFGPLQTHPAN